MPESQLPDWAMLLPTINAALNATATVLLLLGFAFIKMGRKGVHRNIMLTAFVVSVVFLASYLTYHWALHHYTGTHGKPFDGRGTWRTAYFTILISHVILAMGVAVLAPWTIWLGLKERWTQHRKLAKLTFPIWLYVSITGVVIYWMLYHF